MNLSSLYPYRSQLLLLSILGFVLINVPFLYIALFNREVFNIGMSNALARVFMGEAMILMLFFAYLIHKLGWTRPGWLGFLILSMLGSMAFSIPFILYRQAGTESER